jgi:protein SCO1/2
VFHPRLVGLTPTEATLQGYAAAYKIKWNKVEIGADRPYLMDHSASLYLVDPTGTLAGKFPHQMDSKRIAEKIAGVMNRAAAQ